MKVLYFLLLFIFLIPNILGLERNGLQKEPLQPYFSDLKLLQNATQDRLAQEKLEQKRLAKEKQYLIENALKNFENSSLLAINNVARSNYLQGKNHTTTAIKNLDILAKIFLPLLERIKKLKTQSQNSLQKITEQNNPQNTQEILQNTKKILQDSKNSAQENEKVSSYIRQAKEFQELKQNALNQNNWISAQDLENRNIHAIQKAIDELEKNNATQNHSDQKKDNNKIKTSKKASDKLSQIQKYQEKIKKDRQKVFGKKKNEIQKTPVEKDW